MFCKPYYYIDALYYSYTFFCLDTKETKNQGIKDYIAFLAAMFNFCTTVDSALVLYS
jgi:hypothetical protein